MTKWKNIKTHISIIRDMKTIENSRSPQFGIHWKNYSMLSMPSIGRIERIVRESGAYRITHGA